MDKYCIVQKEEFIRKEKQIYVKLEKEITAPQIHPAGGGEDVVQRLPFNLPMSLHPPAP